MPAGALQLQLTLQMFVTLCCFLDRAPQLPDFVDAQSQVHFSELLALLDGLGVPYVCNPKLVRGLDYYTHTVFEWVTDALGAQGAICAGGRYNGLVERLGGRPTPAAGFAMGLDRVALLHEVVNQSVVSQAADVYICFGSQQHSSAAQQIGLRLRRALLGAGSGLKVRVHMGAGNFKKQLKRANACGASWAVLLGADEVEAGQLTLKNLTDGQQQRVPEAEALAVLMASGK